MRDELLGLYERELIFLRKMGAEFAQKYPKIAARLQLDEEKVEDPHVERMIESFAFLTSRVGLKIQDEFPEITESLLNLLYPHYLAPIPSMAITQIGFGSPNDKLSASQTVKRGTRMNSRPVDGTPCRFTSCFDVEILPIELLSASLESPAPKDGRGKYAECSIRMTFRCYGDGDLREIRRGGEENVLPDRMRFYIDGEPQLVYPLHEILFTNVVSVEFRPMDEPIGDRMLKTITNIQLKKPDPVVMSPDEALRPVGFEENEAILPFTKRSFTGYRLLSEYFAFPYKFLFFDVMGLDKAIASKYGSRFEIVIKLKDVTPPIAPITTETFRLGCTPVVNLFPRLADPIYLSQQKYEYQVIPDVQHQNSTEVYSIDQVVTSNPSTGITREFSPFYSLRHTYGEQMEKSFWYAVRRQSQRQDDEGTETFISLVDTAFNPKVPAVEVLNIHTTCTNRDLPARLPFGGKDGDLDIEGTLLLSRVRCLTKPTETIRPPQRRAAQWRLISQLNLNFLSLVNAANGSPEALQEILHLYNFDDSSVARKQILGIKKVEARPTIKQVGERVGTGFVRGFETTVTLDEEEFVGSGLFLFASVLERFLALYSSLNSFNQLVVRSVQREEPIKVFPPRAGEQTLL